MKTFCRSAASFLMCAALLATGVWLILYHGYGVELACMPAQWIEMTPFRWRALGAVLILLVIGYLYAGGRGRRSRRFVSFDTGEGTVSVSLDAVQSFIRKVASEYPAVLRLDPWVCGHRHGIEVDLRMRVRSGEKIPELSRRVQDRVRSSLSRDLGLDRVHKMKVTVQEIVGEPAPGPEAGRSPDMNDELERDQD
ncbi:alkaline shock response membrane anchor protein AmaP [Kiritimatiella glycovorans]|uniref:Alkaline shock response membrane anchor protein AmaP n=1 Tax=Kiritimatiella glycovorans TaxID=1307763 RepID=A0A0G3EC55_9BACT|nr:alkaline shock response membrane anchor protein AmaP [Kiritimatiella glycovorans]AKJ64081.1 hypothetical protein L21SP4_00818 [Kiritimatiella glycovorans]